MTDASLLTRKSILMVKQGALPLVATIGKLMNFDDKVWPTKTIEVHSVEGRESLASYAKSTGEAVVVERDGHVVDEFTPPTTKEKTVLTTEDVEGVQAGSHQYAEDFDPMAIEAELLQNDYQLLFERAERRLEWMRSRAWQDGQITATGRGVSQIISMNMLTAHKVTLTTTARWGETGVSPYANLKTWCNTIAGNGKKRPNICIMKANAWAYLEADTDFTGMLNNRDIELGKISPEWTEEGDLVYMGRIADGSINLRFYVHHGAYEDPDTGAITDFLDDYRVLLGNSKTLNINHFAWPNDKRAKKFEKDFVHPWKKSEDDEITNLMLKRAAVPIFHEPKTLFSAKVR